MLSTNTLKRILLLLSVSFITIAASSQGVYFVRFTNKTQCGHSLQQPETFLSQKAIQRRADAQIAIDSTDLPVSHIFVDSLKQLGADVLYTLKWENGAEVQINSEVLAQQISQLGFVRSVELTLPAEALRMLQAPDNNLLLNRRSVANDKLSNSFASQTLPAQYTSAAEQMSHTLINLKPLHDCGFRGNGKLVAVIDAGFPSVDTIAAFDSVRSHIIDTYNYVYFDTNVYKSNEHGTRVFSVLAAQRGGAQPFQSTAPDASYALYVTECDPFEYPYEFDNMMAAIERADSLGADIITTSLGYYLFDSTAMSYNYAMLDGNVVRGSRYATMAARKGILFFSAMGNAGNSSWYYLVAPADADSIISVGAVDSLGNYATFSSHGPAADGRIKPELVALGARCPVIAINGSDALSNGTSLATPIIAGAAASLWSALPTLTAMEMRDLLIQFGSNYSTPDDFIGYGIPDIFAAYRSKVASANEITSEPSLCYHHNGKLWIYAVADADVTLYSLQGTIVGSGRVGSGVSSWSLSLSKGIYIVVVRTSNGCSTSKIII